MAAQLTYLASVQESAFWEGVSLNGLEELRLRLRGLVPFLDKKSRKVVYTDFQDEITAVREDATVYLPKMTGVQYEKKVQEYLKNHLDHIVIHRLRTNQPLTAADLRGLEQTLVEIGEDDGQTLLTGLLARLEAPSLAHFVRSMVGMDRAAAQAAFSEFLSNRSLTTPQIRFIEMVIDQLTRARCHGAVRALRSAVQQRARGRSRGVVHRQEQRHRGHLREAEDAAPGVLGRGWLKRGSREAQQ